MSDIQDTTGRRGGIPRGLATSGIVLFSYGFRPFFLAAGIWAMVAMSLWITTLIGQTAVGGDYGAPYWHAHEMLFGFAPAVLAGFLLTAVPNWTGRLPVSGRPLMLLFGLWCAGRAALLTTDLIGVETAAAIDSLFLPALLIICAREVIAGRKWKDLKVVAGLGALTLANIGFHVGVISGDHADIAMRLAISAYVALITVVGGRILPSFTRNWQNKIGLTRFPAPYDLYDTVAIALGLVTLGLWIALPGTALTAPFAFVAGLAHLARLYRWRGWTTYPEKLLLVLHIAYGFVPLGFAGIGLAALGLIEPFAALHVLTVGTVATMMLAVMTRATRGHTGRVLTASRLTILSYASIILCALLRPLADILPTMAMSIYALSGGLWIFGFGLFVGEYGPMLVRVKRGAL
jgi:uncharacterized protein involved in response to NO